MDQPVLVKSNPSSKYQTYNHFLLVFLKIVLAILLEPLARLHVQIPLGFVPVTLLHTVVTNVMTVLMDTI